ncbi:amidohydrolase family protein [Caballeronia sp. LZ065]|uniref:amidohydrolase family protein n=1 Tax=Caballeronia sp. LZ065 TaxID=3038571 RepID=UPI002856B484|nr:amidohydrolase family protein [Caballeronia sp. LZ065]MDR5781569.1 amidohydrolase family protein [Caballeronia sp. LZ065]
MHHSGSPATKDGVTRIIDTHHHLWDLSRLYYPVLTDRVEPKPYGDYSSICRDYLIQHFHEDIGDLPVTRSVHLGATTDPVKETAWLQAIADDTAQSKGFPHAIVPKADLLSPTLDADIDWYHTHRNLRGIRQILSGAVTAQHADISASPAWRAALRRLEAPGWSCDLQLHPVQLAALSEVIAEQPDTVFIIDHAGLVNYHDAHLLEIWRKGIRRLAALPNVNMKLSAFMIFDLAWSVESIRPVVLEMIDVFGVDRCVFGSNFPIDRLACSYHTLWARYLDTVRDFSADEQDRLFYRNAARLYRIE